MRVFTLILISISFQVFSQSDLSKTNELGFNLFKIESNSITLNNLFQPKTIAEISYSKHLKFLSWKSSFSYGNNSINDYCDNCFGIDGGTGALTEFNIESGLSYSFLKEKSKFNPFVEVDTYFSKLNYYASGYDWYGWGFIHDRNYLIGGLKLQVGLIYYPVSNISITVSVATRYGKGIYTDYPNKPGDIQVNTSANTLLKLGFGYLF